MIFSTDTPSASAAIWQNIVSAPVPMSVAPIEQVERGVLVHLDRRGAHVDARNAGGLHHDRPCRRRGATGPLPAFFFRARSFQPMALAPSWMAWGRPQERMICLKPSLPSPSDLRDRLVVAFLHVVARAGTPAGPRPAPPRPRPRGSRGRRSPAGSRSRGRRRPRPGWCRRRGPRSAGSGSGRARARGCRSRSSRSGRGCRRRRCSRARASRWR